MSQSVSTAFIKQYDQDAKEAYQRQGSLLRGSVRTKTAVNAQDLTFQTIGTGAAQSKARHGRVPTMNVSHASATATLTDYYAGEYCDKLDLEKLNIDERQVLINAGAYALGRQTDALIITALTTSSNSTTLTATTRFTFRNALLDAIGAIGARDVPMDNDIYGVISWKMWEWLMTNPEFTNSQYVGTQLPYVGNPNVKNWLGVNWIRHSGLTGAATSTCTGFLYHKTAIGHAIGQEIMTDITWQGERAAWFIDVMMSMGAVAIDTRGVQKIVLDETAAMPTT